MDGGAKADTNLLRNVLGVRLAAAPAIGDAIDKIIMPFDQLAESPFVAIARPSDQRRIGGLVSSAIIAIINSLDDSRTVIPWEAEEFFLGMLCFLSAR